MLPIVQASQFQFLLKHKYNMIEAIHCPSNMHVVVHNNAMQDTKHLFAENKITWNHP